MLVILKLPYIVLDVLRTKVISGIFRCGSGVSVTQVTLSHIKYL